MTDEKRFEPCENCVVPSEPSGEGIFVSEEHQKQTAKPSLLLHACCGPCSTACVERVAPDWDITVFFYNPNITDVKEYEKRKEAELKFIKLFNEDPNVPYKVGFLEGPRDTAEFIRRAEPFAGEPEGGHRCEVCFRMRLEKTAETAAMMNFDAFTTTLTVSPHKDYDTVKNIGKRLEALYKVGFLDIDFKKKDGFKRSIELSKKYDLYRQNFCGCEYSRY